MKRRPKSTPFVLLALLCAGAGACRKPAEPSSAYDECSRLFQAVLDEKGDDAFMDPRATTAERLCEQVPADSIDFEAAQSLATRIRTRREEEKADAARRAAAAVVTRPPETVSDFQKMLDAEKVPPPPVDVAKILEIGQPSAEFEKRYAGCVSVASKFFEKGGTRSGDAFGLNDDPECATKFPELAGKLVYVADGKIFNVTPRGTGERIELVQVDGGFAPAPRPASPDAGSVDAGP